MDNVALAQFKYGKTVLSQFLFHKPEKKCFYVCMHPDKQRDYAQANLILVRALFNNVYQLLPS